MPHPPEPVLCLGGTQSSAFGQLSGLFYLNIPKCVKHKAGDTPRTAALAPPPASEAVDDEDDDQVMLPSAWQGSTASDGACGGDCA